MKLRLEANSLRLRLSEADAQQLAQTGRVAVAVGLPGAGPLTYALEQTEAPDFSVSYAAGGLTVHLPAALARPWLGSEQNGLSATLPLEAGQALRILVEKDLDCRH
ncbi:hypothetical protein LGH70_12910 [Hymenobacter sp. BT635]|uniref:Uncharacterized protein n=1 Tax=Hymenobacter nitidus TaxID=2880929 RepID=A0ABS8ADK2_9BACT|nr:hypothetical protein [Hymenobacter nitidus]MCB2378493.1 hypothetical protein [Hymenobacter nitidus]